MSKEAQQLREHADKFWHEVVSQLKWSSLFRTQGIAKLQAMYDKVDQIEAMAHHSRPGTGRTGEIIK